MSRVKRLPLERDVGELAVRERDPARREVVLVPRLRLVLAPVEVLVHPQLVQVLAAHAPAA